MAPNRDERYTAWLMPPGRDVVAERPTAAQVDAGRRPAGDMPSSGGFNAGAAGAERRPRRLRLSDVAPSLAGDLLLSPDPLRELGRAVRA
jgi:hypothetical protein